MQQSALEIKSHVSPLEQAQLLKKGCHKRGHRKPELHLALPLTSLIDAFSIIVIYLLIGTQSGGTEMSMPAHIALPTSQSNASIDHESTTVRIEKGQYFINDTLVAKAALGSKLAELKKTMTEENTEILIQADQKMDFADLDPLIRAGSEAGIQKLKFAVLPNK